MSDHNHGKLKHGKKEVHTTSYVIPGDQIVIETHPQTTTVPLAGTTTGQVYESSTIPTTTTVPGSREYVSGRQPDITVYEKTTIEHHDNLKEKAESKLEKAKDKILGFIPNPFSHSKDKEEKRHTDATCAMKQPREREEIIRGEQPLTTTTVLPSTSSFEKGRIVEQPSAYNITTTTTQPQECGAKIMEQPVINQNLTGGKEKTITKVVHTYENPSS